MKVIKKINNNVALCLDNNNHEMIAFGNGIGFPQIPYELKDLSKITRTFYCVDSSYINMLEEIDENIFKICIQIIDYAKETLKNPISNNAVFSLADHISFAIERIQKGIEIKMPLYHDLAHLYPKEVEIGKWACKQIRTQLHIYLPKSEIFAIALHLINAEQIMGKDNINESNKIIKQVTHIIEEYYDIIICQEDFNYARFVSHMQYLLKRKDENINISSRNKLLFEEVKESCPEAYSCTKDIEKYFIDALNWHLNEEELLYIILHVNRLCSREDCNR